MKPKFQEIADRLDLKVEEFQLNGKPFKVWREGHGENRGTLEQFAETIVRKCVELAQFNDDPFVILDHFDMPRPE